MTEQPYHKYVFDFKKRKFVGKFEEMYQNEDKQNYDSWFQDDLTHLGHQLSLLIINQYNFNSILDIGCGKGAFTHLLKKANNHVTGVDISKTAIKKAKSRYRNVKFLSLTEEEALNLKNKWDLIVMKELLSYIKNWRKILKIAAKKTSYLFISLYCSPNPISFIKNLNELKNEINKYFTIEIEVIWNGDAILILGKRRKNG